jgi:aspartate aminotransferase
MFEHLEMAPPDAILGLSEAFKKDPRPGKINLSVGVYKDAAGRTPILNCVKEAERRLLLDEQSKGYLSIDGMPEYARMVRELLFGEENPLIDDGRAVTLQTPGGTGAVRVAADFIARKFPGKRVWCSKPTWVNHPSIFTAAGLEVAAYPYLDASGLVFEFERLIETLQQIPAGDAVCLHACCHNPSGIDPTVEQWREISQVMAERDLLPLVDFAYQGFGEGLYEDTIGLQELLTHCGELLIASSFSKNFGLYGERVGALTIVGTSENSTAAALSHAKVCVRVNYSNPPQHGAAIVHRVWADADLRLMWDEELAAMRSRIHGMRKLFVQTMHAKHAPRDFSFLERQRGMFSFSGLSPMQVDELRNRFAIYIVGSGRINVAGMTEANMEPLCDAMLAVL